MAMRTWKHDLAENGHRMGKRTLGLPIFLVRA